MPAKDSLGDRGGNQEAPGPGNCTKIAELLAGKRCSPVLDSLATTDVGRTAGPQWQEEGKGAASEASEWEDREREEQLALLRERKSSRLEEKSRRIAVFLPDTLYFLLSFLCL